MLWTKKFSRAQCATFSRSLKRFVSTPPHQGTHSHTVSHPEQEKQAENIVEKLCQRFRLSEDPRQWRDIAFCLSLLPFKSEKSVKKLIDGLQYYRDKLHEEGVFTRFQEILTKARANKSSNKPDAELNEFENVSSTIHRSSVLSRS